MNAIRNTDPMGLQYILGIPKEIWSNLYIPMSSSIRSSSHTKEEKGKMLGLVTKLRFCSRCQKKGHNRRSCKLLPIPSDDNTHPTMAPSFTMRTEPPVIPDEDVPISLH
ncbi:hypothetical protein GIB67_021870 [Kingdonia uniflora]|uniref:CCHC-type domain-containing protein n=1 Tax=Kingdonia uniflora TaxID=39325 RepID=A0A7J7NF27_9MAGN|nr:hypothetical protein GIB67_021870 [Kingdonia uniflora]